MAELSSRLGDLSPAKLKLLARRLKEEAPKPEPARPEIVPAPEERYEPFPLTDVQQAYWLGRSQLFELGNVASHGYTELEFPGMEVERLETAWRRLIERHEMLRAIVLPDGRQQILREVPPYRVEVLDLRGLPAEEAEGRLASVRSQMSHQVIPSDRWPLFELRTSLLDGERVRIHLSFDILIADLWSFRLLVRELGQLYFRPETELPPLELSFRDYVLTQVGLEGTERFRRSQQYWLDRLDSLPPAPQIPLVANPGALLRPRFVRRRSRLDADLWSALRARAARAGLTPSGVLLAAYAEALAAWSKEPRFTLNVTLFNRLPLHPQVNQVVGDFTSLTLLSVDGSLPSTFEMRARAIQEQLWRDLEHSHFSGVRALRELARRQATAPRALMPVVFTSALFEGQEDASQADAAGGGRQASEQGHGISQTPQVWLDHQVRENRGALLFNWDAVDELFPPGLLDAMFGAYCRFLESLARGEESWQGDRPFLVPDEPLALYAQVNATQAAVSGELLQELFARQAEEARERPAVIAGARRLSYGEVVDRARSLGRRLRGSGARPNRLVAVVMEKGWEQVVAVFGVLEAGAAYLPVDPSLPQERIEFLLSHGEVELALTQSWVDERVSWPEGVRRLWVDEEPWDAGQEPLGAVQSPGDLAYVIFTSGSTGLPKGVMIDHRGAVNTILDINDRFQVGAGDRVLALSSLSFDLSVWDIFGVLAAGGCLVLPEPEAARDPERWSELMVREGVTVWNTVPALLEMLVEYATGRTEVGPLRLALLSGDWIPVSLPERVRALAGPVEVISLGGATEASIWSIFHPIEQVDPAWASIPYGRPLRNQTFHVLDDRLELRPVWVPGELYIGGVGLAHGYWRDEAKTKASFLEHPRTGERLYRTGDLGRYLPDGTIEFLGREDHQVKIQGHRIELGEIEAALEQHPQVRGAVVLVFGDPRRQRSLTAYVVTDPFDVETESLREHLQRKLPAYMVPASWVRLESLPLSSNGKVDRQALAAPEAGAVEERGYAAPRTPVEAELVRLWEELLGAERVGVHDSFFELGGNSLLAIRMTLRLRESFQVDVPMQGLFEEPTVAGLAVLLARCRAEGRGLSAEKLPQIVPDPASRHLAFPLTDVQQAYWLGRSGLFELGNVSSHVYNEIDAPGIDLGYLEQMLRRLVDRHEMLRAVVLPDGRQRILPEVPPYEIEVLDLRGRPAEEVREQLAAVREQMSHQVLPADRWPLFEVRATLLDGAMVRLHISIDILLADGWSSWLLQRDMVRIARGQELPPLELSFRDYVIAEQALESSEKFRRAQQYWHDRLSELPPAPQLPLAVHPGSLTRPRFTRRSARLSAPAWARLRTRARRAGLTSSGLLLAAFAEVLGAWSKEPRFTLNVTTFRRLPFHPQVNDLVGDFTSLTLVAVDTELAGPFELRARAVQEQLWRDLEHFYVSGVRVLRELARRQERAPGALMPVVFTSLIFNDSFSEAESPDDRQGRREPGYSISQTPQVWLDHQVKEDKGALVFNWDAVADLFPPGLLDAMFSSYCRFLDELAQGGEAWSDGRSLAPAEHLEIYRQANATEAPIATDLLQELFARRAGQAPDRVAVISGGRRLSYGEVLDRARSLGRRLRELGARPNRLVGIVMEKGWEQVVGALGILESGAAYLPIDPALPLERVLYLLSHGQVELVLTQSWVERRLSWPAEVQRLRVDEEPWEAHQEPLAPVQAPGDLAYVIFTSGSTGLPKGVMIDHRGAVNTILDINERFRIAPSDRVLALSSLSFDLSVYDVFGLLAAGGALVLPETAALRDPSRWLELMAAEGVTVWNTVPALLEMLVEYAGPKTDPGPLRLVLLSGDWIAVGLPDRVRALAGPVEVVSLGGATEASIWSILYPIEQVDPGWASIPYGRAMRNQSFHVLDRRLEPRPVWVPGELCIGGVGLAQGYWRDDEKTRASFVIHPRTGERLYRTGDQGRFLPDGTIEFLGREDHQVKIQGHRIELGEIEAALEQHPRVRSAVVMPVGEPRAYRHLAAYIVAEAVPSGSREARALPRGAGEEEARVIDLVAPELDADLLDRYRKRRTHRRFRREPLALDRLGALLGALMSLRIDSAPHPKYRYPSAGGLYPVQVYVTLKPGAFEDMPEGGLFYYHPAEHRLVPLAEAPLAPEAFSPSGRPLYETASFALLLVGSLAAIAPMYAPELVPDFLTLEAGYMSQLLMSMAGDHELGLCPLAGLEPAAVRRSCGLDASHLVLLALVGGRVDGWAAGAPDDEPIWITDAPSVDVQATEALAVAPPRLLTDKLERIEFKLRRAGVRRGGGSGPALQLPKPERTPERIRLYEARRSFQDFLQEPVPLEELSLVLSCLSPVSLEESSQPKYRYPSAGGLYSVQTWLTVKPGRVEGLEEGLYVYDRQEHRLLPVRCPVSIDRSFVSPVNHELFERSAFSVLLVGSAGQAREAYGNLARDLCLVEAGAMGQVLMTAAPALRIGCCPVGRVQLSRLREAAGLEEDLVFLHGLFGGRIPDGLPVAEPAPVPSRAALRAPSPRPSGSGPEPARASRDLEPVLIDHLRDRLPAHMVPAQWILLEALPLTPNGKVDRRVLPRPEQPAPSQAHHVEPRDPVEKLFADLWKALLGADRVGVHDNFFALGGDSVKAIQFLTRAEEAGFSLTPREFFQHQTIAELAPLAVATGGAARGPAVEEPPRPGISEQELDDILDELSLAGDLE